MYFLRHDIDQTLRHLKVLTEYFSLGQSQKNKKKENKAGKVF